MEDLYGCSINFFTNNGEFCNGLFIIGYLNQRIEKFRDSKNIPDVIDVRVPLSKRWLNTLQVMSALRDYYENEDNRKVEFIISDFFTSKYQLIATGKIEIDFGSLCYEYNPDLSYDPDNDPYLHFMLKEWKLKNKCI